VEEWFGRVLVKDKREGDRGRRGVRRAKRVSGLCLGGEKRRDYRIYALGGGPAGIF